MGKPCRTPSPATPTPKARPETPEPEPPAATGIDYLALTAAAHHEQLRRDERIGYHALYGDNGQIPGQLSIDDVVGLDDRRWGVGVSIQRLQSHWGFTRMPFGRDLAPAMLHRHPGHGEAVARITWCVDQRAIGVITGEVGAGKTVAVRAATANLDPSRHVIIYLANPTIGVRGMLTHIVAALGHTPAYHKAALAPQAAEALAAEHAERGRNPVLVVDEAHLLDNHQLEAIRLLTNHDMDSGSPFAVMLVGQPTLRQRLRLGVLAALDQRIAVRYSHRRDERRRHRRLHPASLQDRRTGRHPVLRRRDRADP